MQRIRQGVSEAEALREWADLANVPSVTRLVGVLRPLVPDFVRPLRGLLLLPRHFISLHLLPAQLARALRGLLLLPE